MVSFYKEYLEIELRHDSQPDEVCTAFSLLPGIACKNTFQNLGMVFKTAPGEILIFYSGKETAPHSKILSPAITVPDNTEFLFSVIVNEANILGTTKIPELSGSSADDLGKFISNKFVRPAIFSLSFDATAATGLYEVFKILSESGNLVYETTVIKNKSNDTYSYPVDLSLMDAGVYSFTLGTATEKFYIDTASEFKDSLGFIRYRKDAGWRTPVDLRFGTAIDYNRFAYTFAANH